MQQQRIGEGRGRELDALAGGLDGGAGGGALGQGLVEDVGQLAAPQTGGQVAVDGQQQRVRHVAAAGQGFGLVQLHPGPGGGQGVLFAQARGQRVGEADAAAHDALLHRVGGAGGQQHRAFARQAAALDDKLAPLLARFPPAVVADVVAETHEDRQRQAEQREGHGGQVGGREHAVVVHPHDQAGQQGDDENATEDARNDGAAQNEEQGQRGRTRTDDHDGVGRKGETERGTGNENRKADTRRAHYTPVKPSWTRRYNSVSFHRPQRPAAP